MKKELKKAIETVKAYLDMDSDINSEYLNAQRTIIKALEQQPCEDCISREQALLALTGKDLPTDRDKLIALFTERIQQLLSVTPQPDVGKWIKVDPLGTGDEAYMCSKCKTGDWDITIGEYKFCPYCGQKKEGVEDEG